MKWEVLDKSITGNKSITSIARKLFKNRNIKTKKEIDEFLNPKNPEKIKIYDLGIKKQRLQTVLKRLEQAKKNKEKIVIFGDYDCDGVCSTAILWETLYKLGFDAMPYIPDRFSEGYGLKSSSFEKEQLKIENCKLIITVDNGIVAYEAIDKAKKRGIDVIVVDHHTKGTKRLSTPYILHSTSVCGSALAWFLAKELDKSSLINKMLDLVALGTVADQMPLLGINRSLVKYGIQSLKKTNRLGLKSLIESIGIKEIGVHEIGFLIAPRINAMGRLSHALDSLRLLCTKDKDKANTLTKVLNDTNSQRQKVVDEVLGQVMKQVQGDTKIIVIDGDYHEGVIGLASGKITEKLYRPSIVLSRGQSVSKASARSVVGFNIIETIKETQLILEGGGHPMAAGFSIETSKIEEFRFKIQELSEKKISDELLEKKLKIDLIINFEDINTELIEELEKLEPTGYGNIKPVFASQKVKIIESKTVGNEGKHLKLKLSQDKKVFDAIWFGHDSSIENHKSGFVQIAYNIETNTWNGRSQIQLKIRDIKII